MSFKIKGTPDLYGNQSMLNALAAECERQGINIPEEDKPVLHINDYEKLLRTKKNNPNANYHELMETE